MRVEKKDDGKYEAITSINGFGIKLVDGISIPVSFIGFGSTHFEAISKCLEKIELFMNASFSSGSIVSANGEF